MSERQIETSFTGIANYIFNNFQTFITKINEDVTDDLTITLPSCTINCISDPNKNPQMIFVYNGSDPNESALKKKFINFTIYINRSLGPGTKNGFNKLLTLLMRYQDAMNYLFISDPALGGSCNFAGIENEKIEADDTNGFYECTCKADINLNY
jgi:hypothetical protein